MSKTTKLELTWIGKENRPKTGASHPAGGCDKSYHAKTRVSDKRHFRQPIDLRRQPACTKSAGAARSAGKIKCIYIDPPFNTQQALEHYDDGVEHSALAHVDARSA